MTENITETIHEELTDINMYHPTHHNLIMSVRTADDRIYLEASITHETFATTFDAVEMFLMAAVQASDTAPLHLTIYGANRLVRVEVPKKWRDLDSDERRQRLVSEAVID